MNKAKVYNSQDGQTQQVWIYCPGCKWPHGFTTKSPQSYVWTWNGSIDKPTFSPSMLVFENTPDARCHSFVVEGRIQFLGDCFHELKNQIVELPEYED